MRWKILGRCHPKETPWESRWCSCSPWIPCMAISWWQDHRICSYQMQKPFRIHEDCWKGQRVLPQWRYPFHHNSTRIYWNRSLHTVRWHSKLKHQWLPRLLRPRLSNNWGRMCESHMLPNKQQIRMFENILYFNLYLI